MQFFCKLQSTDELLEFMETWGYAISFATCQPVEIDQGAKDYNRGFGIIRHNSPKVAANDLYSYDSKLFVRTIDNF